MRALIQRAVKVRVSHSVRCTKRKKRGGITSQVVISARVMPMLTTTPNSLKPLKCPNCRLTMAKMLVAAPESSERPVV